MVIFTAHAVSTNLSSDKSTRASRRRWTGDGRSFSSLRHADDRNEPRLRNAPGRTRTSDPRLRRAVASAEPASVSATCGATHATGCRCPRSRSSTGLITKQTFHDSTCSFTHRIDTLRDVLGLLTERESDDLTCRMNDEGDAITAASPQVLAPTPLFCGGSISGDNAHCS